jgi:hypothetical protein
MANNMLVLKWGTLKDWSRVGADNVPAHKALKRYFAEDVARGAMQQQDSAEQKEAICDLIDAVDVVRNDWTGENMTKDEAKAYVREYDT